MRNKYQPIDIEIITFDSEDVITSSEIPDCPNEGEEI